MIAYQPPALYRMPEVTINPWSFNSLGSMIFPMGLAAAPNSVAPIAANEVWYVPFWVAEPYTITKLWWANGAGIAGTVDVGVWDEAGNLLVSAANPSQAGASVVQTVDVTDTTIARGRYYMGLCASTVTTLTLLRSNALAAGILQSLGCLQQSGITLPLSTGASPATFAIWTRAYIPLFGVQGFRAVGP